MPFTVESDIVKFTFYGKDQTNLGMYTLTLWENYGKVGQNAVDSMNVFELVTRTYLED